MASIHPFDEGVYDGRTKIVLTMNWEKQAAREQGTLHLCNGRSVETRKASRIVSNIYNSSHNPDPMSSHHNHERRP